MPDIMFVNSPRTEEERIKFTRKVIAEGFYQKQGFVVLPSLSGADPNVTVVLPRKMVYQKIEVGSYVREWRDIGERFWEEIARFLPGVENLWEGIVVKLTRYGTVASSEKFTTKKGAKKVFFLREEADISHLAAIIINSILYAQRKGLGITWSKREALMDFIMTRPAMKKLFPHFHPMMSQLARVSAKIRKQSETYLRELRLSRPKEEFEMGKLHLSKLEKKVMQLLVDHWGELVTYDELADVVWGVGEFKTFWALNKLVERMRVKLDKLGIEGKRIESVRGQGYLLR